ncbi:hypothetical protein [Actinoplanes philippinensis]|uniref:hypothetical protein n=1 Tax=Actinoplanes philippinensis TaxID=35752 RepID=UPI0033CB991B
MDCSRNDSPSLAIDVIVAKKSLDVLALRFTLGYLIGRLGIDGTRRTSGWAAMPRDHQAEVDAARRATDRLALVLEDLGFDVGQEFPGLHDVIDRRGVAVVRLGDVMPAIAERLAEVLSGLRR